MKIELPQDVQRILAAIRGAGFEAYVVGGCVRDAILGRTAEDWDITTSALPEEVKQIFPKTIDTGIKHGTVTVMLNQTGYEVTTYRIDGEYEDGRHPKEVTFTRSLTEDLKRRDFTINAMAYSEETGLVDLFFGMEDIQAGMIRCVGEAKSRFGEDALRLMRAVRFAAQLGYQIEGETKKGMQVMAHHLGKVSVERIQAELVKLLCSPHPDELRTAYETGLTAVFLPEFDRMMETGQNHPHHCYSVGEHILHGLTKVPPKKVLRLAMLLHDIAKPVTKTTDEQGIDHFYGHSEVGERMAEKILRRLRFDNHSIDQVKCLVRFHDLRPKPDKKAVRRAVVKLGADRFPLYLQLQRGDILAQAKEKQPEKLERLDQVEKVYGQILEQNNCLQVKDLAISGKDLIQLGMKPGKEIGEMLNRLFDYVLERPEENQPEILCRLAQEYGNRISSTSLDQGTGNGMEKAVADNG